MSVRRTLAMLALWVCGCVPATAQIMPLPSDISVALVATPSTNLHPGELIALALSVTNHGPVPVTGFAIQSTHIDGPFDVTHVDADCDGMVGSVVDLEDGSYFLVTWYFDDFGGAAQLAVGETRTCHLHGRLNAIAAPVTAFGFGLASNWSDPNATNNAATVSLVRSALSVPALSAQWMAMLAALLIGGIACRRKRSANLA